MLMALCTREKMPWRSKASCKASAFITVGQHADVVGLRAIHALGRTGQAAEDVAAAHDHGHLHAGAHDFGDLIGKVVHHLRIDAVADVARQRLAGQLEQHAIVAVSFRHKPYPLGGRSYRLL